MKKIFFVALLWTIVPNSTFAQEIYSIASLNDLVHQLDWNKTVSSSPSIQGSPYLSEDFMHGEIYFDGKYKIEKVPLRLNLYNGDLEFKEKNVVMAIAEPQRIDKIVIGEDTFIYVKEDKKKKIGGFVKMWNAEAPSIITQMKTDFLKKEPAKPYVEPKPDRFERGLDKHFLMISKDEIVKISSVKKLIDSLVDHKSELAQFAKDEKISSGNVEELAKLMEYYHSL